MKQESMSIDRDLERIALQEKRLRFKEFNADVAWALGTALKAAAEELPAMVVIDIQLHGFPLFSYAMLGATPDNWEWIRRKRNVVMRYHRSSYAIGLKHERAQTTLQSTVGLDLKDYSTHGGRFLVAIQGASNTSVEASEQTGSQENASIDPAMEKDIRFLMELTGARETIKE